MKITTNDHAYVPEYLDCLTFRSNHGEKNQYNYVDEI